MASITREETSRGPRWRVRYRRPDGTETSQRFDRRKTAADFAASVEHARRAGTYVDAAGPRTTFAAMTERYVAAAAHKDTTRAIRDSDLRLHILPVLGPMRLGDITALELKTLLRSLEAKLAPTTVERVWTRVTGVFNAAIEAELLARSPAARVRPSAAPKTQLIPLEGPEVEAVIAALPAHYRVAALLAADAGLRRGEVFGLTPGRVVFLTRQPAIRVERQSIDLAGQPIYLRLPKQDKTRQVPVPESVTDALAEHLAAYPRAVVPDRIDGRDVELVFSTERTGTNPVSHRNFGKSFHRAVMRAGLEPNTRFHDLRHYYASVLIDAGLSEREIGIRLGHSSAEVTALYGHLFTRAEDRTRAAVSRAVAERRGREMDADQSDQGGNRGLPSVLK